MFARDYTELRDRPKRWWLWRFGFSIPGLAAGFAALLMTAIPVLIVGQVIESAVFAVWGVVVSILLAGAVYFLWGHIHPSGMPLMWWLIAIFDYRFSQPRRFHGLRKDGEPSTLRWTVIIFEPH